METFDSLNPYCSGRKNRISLKVVSLTCTLSCLNPYCSGRKNRIYEGTDHYVGNGRLNPYCSGRKNRMAEIAVFEDDNQTS